MKRSLTMVPGDRIDEDAPVGGGGVHDGARDAQAGPIGVEGHRLDIDAASGVGDILDEPGREFVRIDEKMEAHESSRRFIRKAL